MRSRGANVFTSTCPAKTASSSPSNNAKSGTFLKTSGLHAIDLSVKAYFQHRAVLDLKTRNRHAASTVFSGLQRFLPGQRHQGFMASRHFLRTPGVIGMSGIPARLVKHPSLPS